MKSMTALLSAATAVIALSAPVAPAWAQAQTSYRLDIPAQDMESALKALAAATREQIIFRSDVVRGKRSNALRGAYTAEGAVTALIRGAGLSVSRSPRGVFVVVAASASAQQAASDPEEAAPSGEIVVTGTHIAGAQVASPLVRIEQRQMREAGQRDLGDVIRSLPSNYNGGQNPGARFQAGTSSNTNASGSSALNLRGLGPDASLTLLNGRRLPYDGTAQGVDLSAIPLDAVAELQVMPDGASALYGSDAVGGVANILLKRDFSGVTTSARLGSSTDGGGFEQEYGVVGGGRWGSGGLLVALQYDHQDAVRSDQRDYTRYVVGPNTLLDAHKHFSGLATGHQDITDGLTFDIDGLYSWRHSEGAEYSTADFAATTRFSNENYSISPRLTLRLPGDWSASLSASYGANKTIRFDDYIDKLSGENDGGSSVYDNYAYGGELEAEGRLFAMPGGDVRLAVGGGYRFNHLRVYAATNAVPTGDGRGNYYGYGELSVPLVSPANAVPLINRLSFTAALRHEEYDRFGGVTTPKLGLVYAPLPDFDLKLSWGRSFKAPTLRNEFQLFSVVLQPSFYYGGNYPSGSTILFTSGGNRDLKPERARTLSTTIDLHPRVLPGLKLSATYFDIDYTDRVVQPVSNATLKVLDNPALQEFIDYAPTQAQQAAVIARDYNGLGNYTGTPYNPAKVVAIVRNQLVNAARQRIRGVDVNGSYRIPIGADDLTLSSQASWLRSNQRNTPGAPLTQLAGTNFNPPRFRARAGATGHFGSLTAALFGNYTGPITDLNVAPPVKRGDMTTFDLSLMWKAPATQGLLKGFEIGLYVNNLTNARPPYLEPFDDTTINYDSTNYSPLGRFVSVSLRKAW
jgi:iron complex outermembrane receptor protein